MRNPKESEIQKTILDWLRWNKFFAWKNNTAGIFKKATNTYIPSHNVGAPDIFAIKAGKFYGIEVKRPKNEPTTNQLEWGRQLEAAGGKYIVATSLDNLINML